TDRLDCGLDHWLRTGHGQGPLASALEGGVRPGPDGRLARLARGHAALSGRVEPRVEDAEARFSEARRFGALGDGHQTHHDNFDADISGRPLFLRDPRQRQPRLSRRCQRKGSVGHARADKRELWQCSSHTERRPRVSLQSHRPPDPGAADAERLDGNTCPAVERTPERVSGAWVFKGTRVPVKALFENIEEGASVDDFVEWFPGVKREQALAVLAHAEKSLAVA